MLSFRYPFARLALHVNLDRLRLEVDGLPPHLWSPDRLSGVAPSSYTTLALVSHCGRESNIMSGPFVATPYLESCPYVRQILASFEASICEVRLRWLGPRSLGGFHFDRHRLLEDRYRVHVPIYTTPHARFYCADRNVHMAAGTVWTFDRMRRHAVFNDDLTTGRLHLIMDFAPSERLRGLVEAGCDGSNFSCETAEINFNPQVEPELQFEAGRPPPVWSAEKLRGELDSLRERLADPQFDRMRPHTERLLKGWRKVWSKHRESRTGWPQYRKLARTYYSHWRSVCPTTGVREDDNPTNWVASLLDTGAFVPHHAPKAPQWASRERYKLLDALRVAIGKGGEARASVDGARWRPISPVAVRALVSVARGAGPKDLRMSLGRNCFDEVRPVLQWLAKEGALCLSGDTNQPWLTGDSSVPANPKVQMVLPSSTVARLKDIRVPIRDARFRCTDDLYFLIRPTGETAAYLPCVKGHDLLFADSLPIAHHMALGCSVEEIARATGYSATDDFLLLVAWLWDLLPFQFDGDAELRRSTLANRLKRGHSVTVATIQGMDPVSSVLCLPKMGCHALVVDSSAHISFEALRIAAATARVNHVDLLVKTSDRIGIAEIGALPVAGFVVADCDADVLRDVEVALSRKDPMRPFVVAIVETMKGLADLDVVARSSYVDAVVVGAGDLARNARLAGADPNRVVADAHARVRRLAAREGKILAAAPRNRSEAKHARRQGAKLMFQGSDITILAEGFRAAMNEH
jgi:hypothetical protein